MFAFFYGATKMAGKMFVVNERKKEKVLFGVMTRGFWIGKLVRSII